jgi:HK97 family phage major capsid protein
MDSNTEQLIIKKADMLAAELKASGGTLDPVKGNRFFRKIVEAPTLLNIVRTEQMSSDTLVIPRISLGQQFLHAATPNARLAENKRSKPTTDKLEFPSKEVIGEILLPYESLEDNIEGEDFVQTVLDLVAERAAIDLENLLLNGDTAVVGTDPYLGLMDGMLKRIVSNTVDALDYPMSATLASTILLALPNRYRRERSALRWMLHPDDQERLIARIANRQTALGDAMLTGDAPIRLSRIISEGAAYLPDGVAVLGNPKNFILGLRRRFTLESERLISERQIKFVLTARVAVGIQEEEAAVKVENIGQTDPEA